jgi:hypothetical protein
MRRRFLRISVGLSLLLCLAAIAMWVRCQFVCDTFTSRQSGRERALYCARSTYHFLSERTLRANNGIIHETRAPMRSAEIIGGVNFDQYRFAGFVFGPYQDPQSTRVCFWAIPHWFAVGVFVILPFASLSGRHLATLRRRRCIAEHRCIFCGYDLRASPDRCPECGAVPPPAAV